MHAKLVNVNQMTCAHKEILTRNRKLSVFKLVPSEKCDLSTNYDRGFSIPRKHYCNTTLHSISNTTSSLLTPTYVQNNREESILHVPEAEQLPPLNDEQQSVVDLVLASKNVFFTGCAGSGKSLVLKAIRQALRHSKNVMVTASTGIAASNIHGTTVHRWSGIGVSKEWKKRRKGAWMNLSKWRRTDVLIIDESLQLVCVGDFLQLPPVSKGRDEVNFCFESAVWKQCIQATVQRQTNTAFLDMLNEIRVGRCSRSSMKLLQECQQKQHADDGISPTVLYARNEQVDAHNRYHLDLLEGPEYKYVSMDSYEGPKKGLMDEEEALNLLLSHCSASKELQLKLNAQVMLTRNQKSTLVNGSRGMISSFKEVDEETKKELLDYGISTQWIEAHPVIPVVSFFNGETRPVYPMKFTVEDNVEGVGTRLQIPLRLAYAITIHRSQGLTLTKANINLAGIFEYGHAYVALSRMRSTSDFRLLDFDPSSIRAHPKVLEFYDSLDNAQPVTTMNSENPNG